MDELRKERKIKLVLKNTNVDKYINLDTSGKGIENWSKEEQDFYHQTHKEKVQFRFQLAKKISITKLSYMFTVL